MCSDLDSSILRDFKCLGLWCGGNDDEGDENDEGNEGNEEVYERINTRFKGWEVFVSFWSKDWTRKHDWCDLKGSYTILPLPHQTHELISRLAPLFSPFPSPSSSFLDFSIKLSLNQLLNKGNSPPPPSFLSQISYLRFLLSPLSSLLLSNLTGCDGRGDAEMAGC